MSPNPFLRGYDKLSIQLVVHELQPDNTLRELSYVVHAQDQEHTRVLGVQPTLEQAQSIVQRSSFDTGHFSRCWEISAEHLPEDVVNQCSSCARSCTTYNWSSSRHRRRA
ncbi:hypothetical protein Q066_01580 [Pseudomonas aeruginosa BL12]|nr:hypothetical protein Q066_01580 [Pseudomonas aeruginosa BL12]